MVAILRLCNFANLIKLIEQAVKYVYSFNDLILVQSIPFIPRIKKSFRTNGRKKFRLH